MISQKLKEFQDEMDAMFERKVIIKYEVTRTGSIDAYRLKVNVQGLPFEIVGYGDTIDEAEVVVLNAMFEFLNKARKCDLFMTKDRNEYQEVELNSDDIKMIYDLYDEEPDELIEMYAKETKGYVTKLDDGKYEFVIENNNCNIHARATLPLERFAKKYAIYTARNIVDPTTEYVNRELFMRKTQSV
ncbi:MAG: hypothetical protein E7178_04905 [Erysipelotrichaceae bacterium]|nr:hypothetical protein [Erysipelotrichaceae bacterium]